MKRVSIPIVLCMTFLLALAARGLGQSPQVKNPLESDQLFSLKVRDVDIRDVLTIIAEEYGLNLILSPAVSGRITYDIENTSLRDGFNAILRSSGLTYVIEGNIIRVDEQAELRKKLRAELDIYKARGAPGAAGSAEIGGSLGDGLCQSQLYRNGPLQGEGWGDHRFAGGHGEVVEP
jgi:type II secretory pathway component HofQ